MKSTPYTCFIAFVEQERSLRLIINSQKEIIAKIADLDARINLLSRNKEEKKLALERRHKTVIDYERDVNQLSDRYRALVRKRDRVSNPKEYLALEQELQDTQHKNDAITHLWYEANEYYESEKKEYLLQEQELSQQIAQAQEAQVHEREELQKNMTVLSEQEHVVRELSKQVPVEWLEQFYRMKESVPDPVVPLKDGFCTACHHQLSGGDRGKVERSILVHCNECYRFVYTS